MCVLPCLLILDLWFLAMQGTVSVMTLCNWVFIHWQAYLICVLKNYACCSCCVVQSNVAGVKGLMVSCGKTKTPGASSSEQILLQCKQKSLNIHSSFHIISVWCTCCCVAKRLCHECSCCDGCLDFGLVQTCVLTPVCCAPGSELPEVLLWCPKAALQLLNKCGSVDASASCVQQCSPVFPGQRDSNICRGHAFQ